jgi:AcrR family transcriptional regulator
MASSVSATNARLSVDDWVQRVFGCWPKTASKPLTLGHLCTRLGVTKGSFYWHFSDMTAYRTALIDTWAVVRDEDRSFDALAAQPPRERLSRMMTALVGPRHWMLERAMREWARSAAATFAAGIGFPHLSGSRPSPLAAGRREHFLEVMLRH